MCTANDQWWSDECSTIYQMAWVTLYQRGRHKYVCMCVMYEYGVGGGAHVNHVVHVLHVGARGGAHAHGGGRRGLAARHAAVGRAISTLTALTLSLSHQLDSVFCNYYAPAKVPTNLNMPSNYRWRHSKNYLASLSL